MSKQREDFEEAYAEICKPIVRRPYPRNQKGEYVYKEIHEAYLMWQQAQKVAVPDNNIVVNKGDYVELVRTNRERQMINARLVEDVKILRARKNHYKKLYKSTSVPDGWAVVPREPTEAMLQSGQDMVTFGCGYDDIYKTMIEAGAKE